ncbi:MAG: VOC family protein [Polyangiales bacterium]
MSGRFVWRELSTRDPEAATRFYGEVFGWKITATPMGDSYTYYLVHNGEKQIAGFAPKMPGDTSPEAWIGYVDVADVDATTETAKTHGAKVLAGPMDIPNVGRFSLLVDPQGGVITAFHSKSDGDPGGGTPAVGEFCWEQLNTADLAASTAFYASVFPWTGGEFQGMPVLKAGENAVASLMAAPPGVPTHWISHVVVDELAGARARVTRNGGKVMMDEIAVPGIGSFAVVTDPHGAAICLFQGSN